MVCRPDFPRGFELTFGIAIVPAVVPQAIRVIERYNAFTSQVEELGLPRAIEELPRLNASTSPAQRHTRSLFFSQTDWFQM